MLTERWVSLLISVCVSWGPRFSLRFPDSGSPPAAGLGGAEGLGTREAAEVWLCLSLIGDAEYTGLTLDCAWLEG
jgi:hypothetical protein